MSRSSRSTTQSKMDMNMNAAMLCHRRDSSTGRAIIAATVTMFVAANLLRPVEFT
eukprot:m.41768 g.41768  ORF g.41768 m.41768 type:complete len:55 (+) comp14273_c0_seq2:335-499(+)